MDYRQSLCGFHNPYKHKDMKPVEFLDLYIKRLRSLSKKRNGWQRVKLADWIEENKTDQIKFVSRLFPETLQ